VLNGRGDHCEHREPHREIAGLGRVVDGGDESVGVGLLELTGSNEIVGQTGPARSIVASHRAVASVEPIRTGTFRSSSTHW